MNQLKNKLKYACGSVLFALKLQGINLEFKKRLTFSFVFFKHFDHTISLILRRTAILKNIYFCGTPSLMATSVHSLSSND